LINSLISALLIGSAYNQLLAQQRRRRRQQQQGSTYGKLTPSNYYAEYSFVWPGSQALPWPGPEREQVVKLLQMAAAMLL
jgi:hypothetical protein